MKRKYLSDASYESIELLLKRCLMIESFTIKNISCNNDNTVSTELITKDGIKVITLTNRTVKGDFMSIDYKEYRSFMRENGYVSNKNKKNKKKMILYFTDLEQDIILLSKGYDFTNDFKERCPKAKDENLTLIDRIILLHQEYYRWGNRICLYVIYESLLDICFKLYGHRHETSFRFKDYLGDIMKNRLTGKYEEFINLEHIINNLMCCITNVKVRKGEEELYKLKGKFVEEEININTFKFKAIPSGDYESFCYDVDKETFIKIKNTEPHNHNKSYFNKGLYRIYPDDFHNSENQCLIELKVTRMEE